MTAEKAAHAKLLSIAKNACRPFQKAAHAKLLSIAKPRVDPFFRTSIRPEKGCTRGFDIDIRAIAVGRVEPSKKARHAQVLSIAKRPCRPIFLLEGTLAAALGREQYSNSGTAPPGAARRERGRAANSLNARCSLAALSRCSQRANPHLIPGRAKQPASRPVPERMIGRHADFARPPVPTTPAARARLNEDV